MNPEAKKVLKRILQKSLNELSIEEIKFLKARRSYLKHSEYQEYKEIIENEIGKPLVTVELTSENIEAVNEDSGELATRVAYDQVLKRAKSLGYKGPRISREKLEEYILQMS